MPNVACNLLALCFEVFFVFFAVFNPPLAFLVISILLEGREVYSNVRAQTNTSVSTVTGDELSLGGYRWSDHRKSTSKVKALIEAAALEATLRDFIGETFAENINIDFCAKILCENREFRTTFLRCWKKGNLEELLFNDTFRSLVGLPSIGLYGDPTLTQDRPQYVPNHHVTGLTHPNKTSDIGEVYWPLWLLHIPSMTSYKRTGRHTYNGVQKPRYSVLTYTWGRWKRRDGPGPALEVKGTPWEIPSVKEEHFTVEAFYKVIQRMGQEVQWAWVDVACVEQREVDDVTKAAKMEEIDRQAAIFKNSHRAFVWLTHLPARALEQHLQDLEQHGSELRMYQRSRLCLKAILGKLDASLSAILADPWFSSLWTLQEIILRNDSVILTQEGSTVGEGLDMVALAKNCNHIHERLVVFQRIEAHWSFPDSPDYDNLSSKIIQDIDRAGFPFYASTNPNVLYGLTQYRETSRTDNCIRAIVQVYNLLLGVRLDVNPNSTTESQQIELRFAAAICAECPILGQRFVHLQEPSKGRSWCITQKTVVPSPILEYKDPRRSCLINVDSEGRATFRGQGCLLRELEEQWKTQFQEDVQPLEDKRDKMKNFEVILDKYLLNCDRIHMPAARYLFDRHGADSVIILKLGTLLSSIEYYSQAAKGGVSAPEHFGVIVRPVRADKGVGYERVGVCVWNPLAAFGEAGERFDERLRWEEYHGITLI